MQPLMSRPWGALALALAAGGLATEGLFFASSHAANTPLAGEAAPGPCGAVSAQRSTQPPHDPAPPRPGVGGPVFGKVVAITPDRASFTLQTEMGEQVRIQVTPGTVFAADYNRPYRFDLLKVGDQVRVRGGALGSRRETGPRSPSGEPYPNPDGSGGPEPSLVARQVLVRPADERRSKPSAAAGGLNRVDRGGANASDQ